MRWHTPHPAWPVCEQPVQDLHPVFPAADGFPGCLSTPSPRSHSARAVRPPALPVALLRPDRWGMCHPLRTTVPDQQILSRAPASKIARRSCKSAVLIWREVDKFAVKNPPADAEACNDTISSWAGRKGQVIRTWPALWTAAVQRPFRNGYRILRFHPKDRP